jgi:NDP-sugar pyrophosphorylase family protein
MSPAALPIATGIHALVQAGGKGTRLLPATLTTPKPMLPVGGMPMVERMVRRLADAGVERITVIVGNQGDRIIEHLRGLTDLPSSVTVDFFLEDAPLGNAGAMGLVPIERTLALCCFGDLVTALDFRQLKLMHAQMGADMLLTSHFEETRLQLGELVTDGDRVVEYHEKPLKRFLICSGIALMRGEVLSVISQGRTATGLADLVNLAIAAGYTVAHWTHGAYWIDVNSPELLAEANRQITEIE